MAILVTRPESRIDRILDKISKYWKRYPELRLTQLLTNVTTNKGAFYYIDDDELEELIDSFCFGQAPPEPNEIEIGTQYVGAVQHVLGQERVLLERMARQLRRFPLDGFVKHPRVRMVSGMRRIYAVDVTEDLFFNFQVKGPKKAKLLSIRRKPKK